MNYNKTSERLKDASSDNKRNIIMSDESWAFTEQPKAAMTNRIEAHDLFNLFTANIIKAKTPFIR